MAHDIKTWNVHTSDLYGYAASTSFNLKSQIMREERRKLGMIRDFTRFSNANRPAVCPDGDLIAVGTDHHDASQHFLSVMSGSASAQHTSRTGALACYQAVSEFTTDVKWLDSTRMVVASGRGNLSVHQLTKATTSTSTIRTTETLRGASSSYIREVAICPESSSRVAYGGYDCSVTVTDLHRPSDRLLQFSVPSVVGSIKWAPFLSGTHLSCTLDDGKFYLFDARQPSAEAPAVIADVQHRDLFCHERYDDFNVLLGFGDGQIKQLDVRQPQSVLHTVQDPYVDAIGGIEYNPASGAFAVSGYTDVSVYRLHGHEMKVWSHGSLGNGFLRGKGWSCAAAWYNDTTVVVSDSNGSVQFLLQDFDL